MAGLSASRPKRKVLGFIERLVDAQGFQQLGAQGNIPVAVVLALLDAHHHGRAVDFAYLKATQSDRRMAVEYSVTRSVR